MLSEQALPPEEHPQIIFPLKYYVIHLKCASFEDTIMFVTTGHNNTYLTNHLLEVY